MFLRKILSTCIFPTASRSVIHLMRRSSHAHIPVWLLYMDNPYFPYSSGVSHSRAGKARRRSQYKYYGKEAQRRQRGCAKLRSSSAKAVTIPCLAKRLLLEAKESESLVACSNILKIRV